MKICNLGGVPMMMITMMRWEERIGLSPDQGNDSAVSQSPGQLPILNFKEEDWDKGISHYYDHGM